MSDCSICCEKFNKSNFKPFKCYSCKEDDIKYCRACAKHYILDDINDAKCMICKEEFTYDNLSQNFTKVFITGEYKKHRENILLDREKSRLPETQEYASKLKLIDDIEKEQIILKKQKEKLAKEIDKISKKIRNNYDNIYNIRSNLDNSSQITQKNNFMYKCPFENCKGFLNTNYNCTLCNNRTCKHCMEIITSEDHECSPEKIETVKMIKKDSKPCPKCGEMIHKTEGCNQMWCTQCKVAFDWRTGTIENGYVHNPEYFRWMRENGQNIARNPLDEVYDPCGNNVPRPQVLLNKLRTIMSNTSNSYSRTNDYEETKVIFNMRRIIDHIDYVSRQNNVTNESEERKKRELRALYLLNINDEKKWKSNLISIEKKRIINTKIQNVFNLLRIVLVEYIGKAMESTTFNEIKNIVIESHKIREYTNESFHNISKMFNIQRQGITSEFIHATNYDVYLRNKLN